MRRALATACCALVRPIVSGCTSVGEPQTNTSATASKVFRAPAVTTSGDPKQAVLSLHVKK